MYSGPEWPYRDLTGPFFHKSKPRHLQTSLTLSCPREMSNFSKSLTMNWETTCDIPFKRYFLGCATNHTNRSHVRVRKVQNERKKNIENFPIRCIYILFDGFTYNMRGYFASCVVFFRAPKGRGKIRAMSKMSTRIICKTIE